MTNTYTPMNDRRSNGRSSFAANFSYLLLFSFLFLFSGNAQGQAYTSMTSTNFDNYSGVNCWITGVNINGPTPLSFTGGLTDNHYPSGSGNTGSFSDAGTPVATGIGQYQIYSGSGTQNQTYTLNVIKGSNSTYTAYAHAYIDYNDDGDFNDANELIMGAYTGITSGVLIATGGATTATINFTVPISAPPGKHRMRVVINCGSGCGGSYGGPTGNASWGDAKDFNFTVLAAVACSGIPASLAVTPSSASICGAVSQTIALAVNASGYTYQWQESNASGGTYVNVTGGSGGTTASFTTPLGASLPYAPTYYRCNVTCTASSQTTASQVSAISLNSFLNCYCTPSYAAANGGTRGMVRVAIAAPASPVLNNGLTTTNNVAPYYTLYTAASPVSNPGLALSTNYNLAVTVGSQAAASNNVGAWIDYNQNGVFDASEFIGSFASAAANSTTNINFTVSPTAIPGTTAMRVVHRYGAAVTSGIACGPFTGAAGSGGAGETEDYRVLLTGGCISPGNQASSFVTDPSPTTSSCSVKFNRGDGNAGMLVVCKAGSAPTGPTPGTAYSNPNADITTGGISTTAAGSFVIYNSNAGTPGAPGSQVTVSASGLTNGTTYYFAAYEWNASLNCYLLTNVPGGSVAIPLCIQPTLQVSNVTVPTINTTSATLNWTAGNGNKTLIILRQASAVSGAPALTTGYTANSVYGSGTGLASGFVVFGSNGADNATSASVSNLIPSTTYHYAIYSYFSATNCYYLTSPVTGNFTTASCSPGTDATSLTFSGITNNAMTLTFVRGSGSKVLVIARSGSAVTVTGQSMYNQSFTANANFGNGTAVSAGQFVVYDGTGTSVNVTGLSAVSTYHFAVYEYNTTPNCYSITPSLGSSTTLDPTTGGGCAASVVRTTGAGQYVGITPATVLNNTSATNAIYAGNPIGFNFLYEGNPYTTFGVSSNGYIWFGTGQPLATATNPISNASPNLGGSGTINGIIAAAGTFVSAVQHYNTGRSIGYSVTGTTPNRILTVQWKGYSLSNTLGSCYLASHYDGNRLDFQIQLNENGGANSNKIVMAYQDMNPYCVNTNTCSAQIGLRGTSNASFTNRTGDANANWANGAGTLNTNVCNMGASNYLNGNVRLTFTQAATVGPTFTVGTLDCPAGTIPLTAQSGYGSYQWFKDGSVVPGPGSSSEILNATVSGDYTVVGKTGTCYLQSSVTTVSVGSCASCAGTPPQASISPSGASSFCVSGSSQLALGGLGVGSYDYQWESAPDVSGSPGTWGAISGATNLIYNTGSISSSTWFRVQVTCVASIETTTSDEFKITINPLPVVTATPTSITICNGASTGLVAGGASTYSWSPTSGLSLNTGSSVTATRTTSVTYTVTGTDGNGCTNTATSTVLVDNTATAITPGAPFISLGSSSAMTAFHPAAASYSWAASPTLNTNVGPSVIANPTVTTTYSVTAVDDNGCIHTTAVKVTVNLGLPGNVSCGYSWSKAPDVAFSLLSSATVLASGVGPSTDDAIYTGQAIGFPFDFNGITYTTLGVSTNGFVWFGNTNPATTEYTPISTSVGLEGAISVFGANIKGALTTTGCLGYTSSNIGDGATRLSIKSSGSSPNQTFTIEWHSFKDVNSLSTCSLGDYQIILSENGSIDFKYNNYAYYIDDIVSAQVGIRGASNTDFNNRSVTCLPSVNWDNPTTGMGQHPGVSVAGTSNADVCIIDGAVCNNYPLQSLVWRWTPTLTTPTTTPAGTNQLCINTDFSYAGNNTNPTPTYQWLKSGNNIAAATTINYTANESVLGTYYYSFKVTSGGCSRNSYVTTGVVNDLPNLPSGLSNQTRCDNGNVTFSATNPGVLYQVQWSSNGTTNDLGNGLSLVQNVTVGVPITRYARLSRISTGCSSAWVAATGIANPLPTVSAAASPASVCLNSISDLQATGNAVFYTWTPVNSLTPIAGDLVHSQPSVTTTYTVIAVSTEGCSNTATTVVTVLPLPALTATPQSAVCLGQISVTLGAIVDPGTNYSWAPNLFITSTTGVNDVPIIVQISQLTFYTVTATATNGCTDNREVAVATVSAGGTISPPYAIVCGAGPGKLLTVANAAGNSYQWQSSPTGDEPWTYIGGATNTNYTALPSVKTYYRLMAKSDACWNVASTTALVDVSNSVLTVTPVKITDTKITLDWSPIGGGNYNINWGGSSSGSVSNVTPPKTIPDIGTLLSNGTYNITVSQTGVGLGGCPASGTLTGVVTKCDQPVITGTSSVGTTSIKVDWTGAIGDYRVYYRNLFSQNIYKFKDMTTASTNGSYTIGSLGSGGSYEIYVVRRNCPGAGIFGQPSDLAYGRTGTAVAATCTPTWGIDYVRSLCPVQIEVAMHGSPTGKYSVYMQRLTPTIGSVVGYTVTGDYFQTNTGAPGQTYLVAVAAKCATGSTEMIVYPGGVEIKALCNSVSNIVLSHPTCKGFTASWNRDACGANTVNYYGLYLRKQGSLSWNSYKVLPPVSPISPYSVVNWLGKGVIEQVYVRSIYQCSGYTALGPASAIETITTLTSGCRDEEGTDITQPDEPSVQITSADNSEMVSLYPNPNSGQFMIDISRASASLSQTDEVRVEVMNIVGQAVLTYISTIKDGHSTDVINMPASCSSGTYMVRITSGENVYTTRVNISR